MQNIRYHINISVTEKTAKVLLKVTFLFYLEMFQALLIHFDEDFKSTKYKIIKDILNVAYQETY